jgi:hypothetical protein
MLQWSIKYDVFIWIPRRLGRNISGSCSHLGEGGTAMDREDSFGVTCVGRETHYHLYSRGLIVWCIWAPGIGSGQPPAPNAETLRKVEA